MLQAKKITKKFNKKTIVNEIDININLGEVVGLVGPNGAGKTTSFYILVGLLAPNKGEVYLNNKRITNLPMHRRAQLGLCYLPQNPSIFRKLTVKDNLLCAMQTINIKRSKRKALLDNILNKFVIKKIENNYGYSLSGGERRRVEIARTLILKPKFLLLDEPFAGIDPVTIQDIKELIKSLYSEGIGVLITDHNVREALEICHRVYVISEGNVLAHGKVDEILTNSEVRNVYLGDNFKL